MVLINCLLGLAPILWLALALLVLKWPTYKAAVVAFLIASFIALIFFSLPIQAWALASLSGLAVALWPIILVILAAVYTYNLVVETKAMDTIQGLIASLTHDRRVLVLLVAWCFGGFMEGMAGFGTAIAIPASMLVAFGFGPIESVLVCLVANGAPTAFGSIGIPTVTLAGLVNLPPTQLAFVSALEIAPFMLMIPFLITYIISRNLKGMTGICLASGLSFVLPQLLVAYFVGPELCVVVGAVCSLLVTGLLAPRSEAIQVKGATKALAPFLFIFVFLMGTSALVPMVNVPLNAISTTWNGLTFRWVNTPGVWILLSAFLGGWIQGARGKVFVRVFKKTTIQMMPTFIVMISVLACAKVMSASGMIAAIGAVAIGPFYPFIAPWLGAVGTFVTGSGTNSGVLFGQIQATAADQLHLWKTGLVGLNSLGVTVGKMLSPQSLAIGLGAVDASGQDSQLLKKVLPYGLGFLLLMSLVGWLVSQLSL